MGTYSRKGKVAITRVLVLRCDDLGDADHLAEDR